jgi:hypothetical protein
VSSSIKVHECLRFLLASFEFTYTKYSLEFSCITHYPILEKLLDKDIVEIMIRTVWEDARGNAEINITNIVTAQLNLNLNSTST